MSWDAFYASGLDGNAAEDMTWLGGLLDFQRDNSLVIRKFLAPDHQMKSLLEQSLAMTGTQHPQAEAVILQPHWSEVLNLKDLDAARAKELEDKGYTPKATPVEPEAKAEAKPDGEDREDDDVPPQITVGGASSAEPVPEPHDNIFQEIWPSLVLTKETTDQLRKISDKKLKEMIHWATTRLDAYVTLEVVDNPMFGQAGMLQAIKSMAARLKEQTKAEVPLLLLADAKNFNHKTGRFVSAERGDCLPGAPPAGLLKAVINTAFDKQIWQEDALFCMADGRTPASASLVNQVLNKKLLSLGKNEVKPRIHQRLLYHNREYEAGGKKASARVGKLLDTRAAPNPSETLFVVPHAKTKVYDKERKWLSLPGWARTRAIGDLNLRDDAELSLTLVKPEVRTAALAGVALDDRSVVAGADADADTDAEGFFAEEAEAPEDDADMAARDAKNCLANDLHLLPWEPPELQAREWYNLFGTTGAGAKRLIVHFTPAGGLSAVAAAREMRYYLGLCYTQEHRSVIRQTVILAAVLDLARGKNDGFYNSRFLTRMRSLGSEGTPSTRSGESRRPASTPSPRPKPDKRRLVFSDIDDPDKPGGKAVEPEAKSGDRHAKKKKKTKAAETESESLQEEEESEPAESEASVGSEL